MPIAGASTRKRQPITQKLQRFSPMPGQSADLALKTSLRSSYLDIKKLRDWLGNLGEFAGLGPAQLLELRAAAIEAFIYLIEEAYDGEDSGLIKATALVRGSELRLVLRDFGRQFLKPRLIGVDPEIPDASGHCLLLIRAFADEVKFHTSLRRGSAIEIMKLTTGDD
jgi:anti-sigma regulatory factor (Ser/Thr protein kinase)